LSLFELSLLELSLLELWLFDPPPLEASSPAFSSSWWSLSGGPPEEAPLLSLSGSESAPSSSRSPALEL
jgi:hypothetical protein